MLARATPDRKVLAIAQQPGIPDVDKVETVHAGDLPRHIISRDRIEVDGSANPDRIKRAHAVAFLRKRWRMRSLIRPPRRPNRSKRNRPGPPNRVQHPVCALEQIRLSAVFPGLSPASPGLPGYPPRAHTYRNKPVTPVTPVTKAHWPQPYDHSRASICLVSSSGCPSSSSSLASIPTPR